MYSNDSHPQDSSHCAEMLAPLLSSNKLGYAVLLSCLIAVFVNLSTFMAIGKTSPATYNVIGQTKMVATFMLGWMIFGDRLSPTAVCGSALAVAGVGLYSYFKAKDI